MDTTTYNRTSQLFHWFSALVIISMLVMGTIMVRLDDAAAIKTTMYNGHVFFGILIVLVTIGRLIWLLRSKRPQKLPMPRWEALAFTSNHWLLYLFIFVMGLSGISMLLLSGITPLPGNIIPTAIQDVPPRAGHNLFSKVMLLLFLMIRGLQLQVTLREKMKVVLQSIRKNIKVESERKELKQ